MTEQENDPFTDTFFTPQQPAPPRSSWLLWVVMGAVLLWGLVLALGAFLQKPSRALIPVACTLVFLGFWVLMIALRRWRQQKARDQANAEEDAFNETSST